MRRIPAILLVCVCGFAWPQSPPEAPPSLPSLSPDGEKDSLLDLLQMELIRQVEKAQPTPYRGRPKKPDSRRPASPSLDYQRYVDGPDADPEKALEILRDKGLIPGPDSAAKTETDLWSEVPPERRLNLAREKLERHEADDALLEINRVLQTADLDLELLKEAIPLRIKALFEAGKHEACMDSLQRFQAYFPEEPEAAELRAELEQETGLSEAQEEVRKNPNDLDTLNHLVGIYQHYQWDDLALAFLEESFEQPSAAICTTLATLYYRRQNYRRLVEVASQGHTLEPTVPRHLYNEAVGLYHLKDPVSISRARTLLTEAQSLSTDPAERKRIEWYLARLPKR